MGIQSVNPSQCKLWDMHDRLGDGIDVHSCAGLIRSLQRNGQRHPVLGRPCSDELGYRYELIYGARRLFVARHLGIDLLVDVRSIDDRTALIEMDIENRVRSDISPYERGLSYRHWLRAGHFDSQAALARCLGVSEAQVSRLLKYADLPTAVVEAFHSSRDIREEWAVALAKLCADSEHRHKLMRRARARAQSQSRPPPQVIYESLVHAGPSKTQARAHSEVVKTSTGSPFMRLSIRAKTIHLILSRDSTPPDLLSEITKDIRKLVEDLAPPERRPARNNSARTDRVIRGRESAIQLNGRAEADESL